MHNVRIFSLILLILLAVAPVAAQDDEGGVVNIYSARHYGAIEEPFVKFTEETGIEIRVSQGSPRSLLERLRAEGDQTPADVFLAIDAGVLSLATEEGLLQPVDSEMLTENIDPQYRDPDGHWYGLSLRPRTIMYSPEAVDPSELSTYEALADSQWSGRLCMRPGSHIYTVSLIGSIIAEQGVEEAESIVSGWVANEPTFINSDTRQLEAVAAGQCDVAIANAYYLGRLKAEDPEFPVEIFWANQDGRGTFYNINGAGLTAAARNRENAIRFIEYFSTVEGQDGGPEGFPGSNYEYPTNPDAEVNEILQGFGEVELDSLPLTEYGELQLQAIDLIDRTGYSLNES